MKMHNNPQGRFNMTQINLLCLILIKNNNIKRIFNPKYEQAQAIQQCLRNWKNPHLLLVLRVLNFVLMFMLFLMAPLLRNTQWQASEDLQSWCHNWKLSFTAKFGVNGGKWCLEWLKEQELLQWDETPFAIKTKITWSWGEGKKSSSGRSFMQMRSSPLGNKIW